jgi:hypothetical protein
LDVSSANRIVLRAKFTPLLPMTQLFCTTRASRGERP